MTFPYENASWNTHVGRCQPGAHALMEHARTWGIGDMGCFNDRTVRGSSAPSTHREGRAVDLRIHPRLRAYVTALILNAEALGVQQIIFERASWRCDRVGGGWKPYTGVNPHLDHAHVELTWHAARTLTVAKLGELIDRPATPIPPAPLPAPPPPIVDLGATDMTTVQTKLVPIGPLDPQGNGWTIVDFGKPVTFVSTEKHGPFPPVDGYWPIPRDVSVQVRDGTKVVVVVNGGWPGSTPTVRVSAG